MALMAADEVKIFEIMMFSERGKKGERLSEPCQTNGEGCSSFSVGASSFIYGSHFVSFPVLPNMELQSCSVPASQPVKEMPNLDSFQLDFYKNGPTGKEKRQAAF